MAIGHTYYVNTLNRPMHNGWAPHVSMLYAALMNGTPCSAAPHTSVAPKAVTRIVFRHSWFYTSPDSTLPTPLSSHYALHSSLPRGPSQLTPSPHPYPETRRAASAPAWYFCPPCARGLPLLVKYALQLLDNPWYA
eukprot:1772341-Pleurochrysis_carterae.AAC.2